MCSGWHRKLKLITINQIVEALLERGKVEEANQASIILKTAMICDELGIEKAMEYYDGGHNTAEFAEFVLGSNAPVCRDSEKTRYTGKSKEEK